MGENLVKRLEAAVARLKALSARGLRQGVAAENDIDAAAMDPSKIRLKSSELRKNPVKQCQSFEANKLLFLGICAKNHHHITFPILRRPIHRLNPDPLQKTRRHRPDPYRDPHPRPEARSPRLPPSPPRPRLQPHSLVSARKRGAFVSVQLLSRWAPHAGLDTLTADEFLRKYPHVFEVFTHPVRKNSCCKFTSNFSKLLELEEQTVRCLEDDHVIKLRKIMSMSVNGRVHLHAIRLLRRELGFPENFRDSIIRKHTDTFRMVDWEIVELVHWNDNYCTSEFSAEIEKWREKEYNDKWLSEFEVKYAFPINFPTGFKMVPGFKEKLRNWQRLSYVKSYERVEKVGVGNCGGPERYEKRAVGIIHELLRLTVEKMVNIERLTHFRKDLGMEVNLREVVLKHPGIFYLSTRGKDQMI